ncbi:MAG: hypothetical protein E7194_12270, partial [Erysipelotrichaceae bacterium]|nr:hypothetical protein [Erysipelotrichaceae bacterium]
MAYRFLILTAVLSMCVLNTAETYAQGEPESGDKAKILLNEEQNSSIVEDALHLEISRQKAYSGETSPENLLYSESVNASAEPFYVSQYSYDDSENFPETDLDELVSQLPEQNDRNEAEHYYYNRMDDVQKAVYWQVLKAAETITGDRVEIEIGNGTYSPEYYQLNVALYAVAAENPWITANIDAVSFGFGIQETSFTITLSASRYHDFQKAKAHARLDQIVRTMGDGDRFSRIVNLLIFLQKHVEYDYDDLHLIGGTNSNHAHDIIGGLLYNTCVCEGFAYMIKAACDAADVPCIFVTTDYVSDPNQLHAVNYILMDDGNWYLIDGTNICKGMDGSSLYDDLCGKPLKGEGSADSDARYAGARGVYPRDGSYDYIIEAPQLNEADYVYAGTYEAGEYGESTLEYAWDGGLFAYEVNEDGVSCTITGYNDFSSGDLIIPEEIDGYKTTGIASHAFFREEGFTGDLTIPETVKEIGDFAFYNCANIAGSLRLPTGLTAIGKSAFMHDSKLGGSISLTDSLQTIGSGAFYNCQSLTGDVYINERLVFNPNDQFFNCIGIESFTISTNHPDYASADGEVFSKDMKELVFVPSARTKELLIPDGTETIGSFAVHDCSRLSQTQLKLPETLKTISDNAFFETAFSGDLYIPDSVVYIGDRAFYAFDSFNKGSLHLPSNLQEIGNGAFQGCAFAGDIYIPDSLEIWPENYYSIPFVYDYANWSYTVKYSCTNLPAMQFYASVFRNYGNWMGSEMNHTHLDGDYCSDCGQSKEFTVPNVCPECGFTYNHGEVLEPALCSSTGVLLTKCEKCGSEYRSVIPSPGTEHIFEALDVEATCMKDGYYIERCTICGFENVHTDRPAHGHDYSEWKVVRKPEPEQAGMKERICAYDGRHREYRLIEQDEATSSIPEMLELSNTYLVIPSGAEMNLSAKLISEQSELEEIVWKTEDRSVAEIDETGKIKATGVGNTKVTAEGRCADGRMFENTCDIYVYEPDSSEGSIHLNESEIEIEGIGTGQYLFAADTEDGVSAMNVSMYSEDEQVAEVSPEGIIWAKGYGETNIIAASKDGHEQAICHVTVFGPVNSLSLPENVTVFKGENVPLDLVTDPSPIEANSIAWESWNDAIVTVKDGILTGTGEGMTVVTATAEYGKKRAYCNVTVVEKVYYPIGISMDKTELIMHKGEMNKLTVTLLPGYVIDKSVSWASSDESVAIVDNTGQVTALSEGITTITAVTANNLYAECRVVVEKEPHVLIYGSSLGLDGKIGINFYLNIAQEDLNDLTVVMKMDEKEDIRVPASEGKASTVAGQKLRMFVYPVAAKEMRD